MSLIDVDSWVTEQESIERLHSSILADIVSRNNYQVNSKEYLKLSANVRIKISQFERELLSLKTKLNTSVADQTITVEENEKRKDLIRNIEFNHKRILNKFRNISSYDSDNAPKSVWQSNATDKPVTSVIADPRQQTIEILEEQNRGLSALTETISRQKNLASRLGQEVEEQNEILDDLTDHIHAFDGRVNSSTRQISDINAKDSTWGYWLTIVLLFILICIVGVI